MHKEIEALLLAYAKEQTVEQQVIAEVMTALAELSSSRRVALDRLAAALKPLQPEAPAPAPVAPEFRRTPEPLSNEIAEALSQLRASNGSAVSH